jgi:PAT family beta-lactamase induction signal transducer AmpG
MSTPNQQHDDLPVHVGSPDLKGRSISPWSWIPTVNFASGLPYVVVATLSTIVFKNMGVSNELIGVWTALLLTPYTFKPLWGPLIDRYWTKRNWIILTQALIGLCFLLVATAIRFPTSTVGDLLGGTATWLGIQDLQQFFLFSLVALAIVAFASATHDIACDGFYMLALREGQQSYFVGIRSTFYRMAMILGGGLLPVVAGYIQDNTGPEPVAVRIVADPAFTETKAPITWNLPQRAAASQAILVSSTDVEGKPGELVDLQVRLAAPPPDGTEVVVITRFKSANIMAGPPRGLNFTAGERLAFGPSNWDQPSTVTLRVAGDVIRSRTEWNLTMAAGDIVLSWTYVFLGGAALFLGFAFLHSKTLPISRNDALDMSHKPAFHKPVFWLFVAVGVPAVAWWVSASYLKGALLGAETYGLLLEKVGSFEGQLGKALPQLLPVVTSLLANSLIIFVAFIILRTLFPVRKVVSDAYQFASDRSGIGFFEVFVTFFSKKNILVMLLFILLFRLGEAQIVKMGVVFLLDETAKGGLGLSAKDVGIIYQTIGILCLTIGGIIGGYLISTYGLKKVIWPLVACMHVPNLLYVYLAYAQPTNLFIIGSCVGIEQLGYGIGFAAFMMYLIYAAQGEFKTSHYALCTGFMSLGMQIPMGFSGFFQVAMGYPVFFIFAFLLVIPGVLVIPFLPMEDDFGKRTR